MLFCVRTIASEHFGTPRRWRVKPYVSTKVTRKPTHVLLSSCCSQRERTRRPFTPRIPLLRLVPTALKYIKGAALVFHGRRAEGREALNQCFRLDPRDPARPFRLGQFAASQYLDEDYEGCIRTTRQLLHGLWRPAQASGPCAATFPKAPNTVSRH